MYLFYDFEHIESKKLLEESKEYDFDNFNEGMIIY